MSAILAAVLQWMTYSTWAKKWSATIGGIFAGLWLDRVAGDRVAVVLMALGVSADTWQSFLLAAAGACGISVSVALSNRKAHLEAGKPDPAPSAPTN